MWEYMVEPYIGREELLEVKRKAPFLNWESRLQIFKPRAVMSLRKRWWGM